MGDTNTLHFLVEIEMKLYLVVYDTNSGACELANVGVFVAEDKQGAIKKAREQWRTNADLYAEEFAEIHDGWSYYV